jgi:hypothetical protein
MSETLLTYSAQIADKLLANAVQQSTSIPQHSHRHSKQTVASQVASIGGPRLVLEINAAVVTPLISNGRVKTSETGLVPHLGEQIGAVAAIGKKSKADAD